MWVDLHKVAFAYGGIIFGGVAGEESFFKAWTDDNVGAGWERRHVALMVPVPMTFQSREVSKASPPAIGWCW